MSGYEIKVSVTALCPCCGEELPSNAYNTIARPSEGVFDRDNPWERTDRRVSITPCATCFVPRAAVAELIDALEEKVVDAEQRLFEYWLDFNSPSGDHEDVQRQWLASSEYLDFVAEWGDQIAALSRVRGAA